LDANFFDTYRGPKIRGLPKYAQLRETLLAAIDDGFWVPGGQLPTEVELTRLTPFSLGTIQKALRALADEGVVVRRHGHGTFVTEKRRRMSGPWHCRFLNDDATGILPVYPRIVLRRRLDCGSPWACLLNRNGGGLVQIDRVFAIDDEFQVYGKFFLNADRFAAILDKTDDYLERTNFKVVLRREFNVTVSHISQTARMMAFPDDICRAIGIAAGTTGLCLEILGHAGHDSPVYYHELFIPPTGRRLYISDDTHLLENWT
jgi:GntR family transcriptional regulator